MATQSLRSNELLELEHSTIAGPPESTSDSKSGYLDPTRKRALRMEVADDSMELDCEHTHAGAAFDTLRTCCNGSDAKSSG